MLGGLFIDRSSDADNKLAVYQSRCLRMRLMDNQCERCVTECPHSAISFEPELLINPQKCSECMRCTAVCPTDALAPVELDFSLLMSKLKQSPKPVLSCERQPSQKAIVKTDCLGWLGQEHAIALSLKVPGELQINLSACSACRNSFIVDKLKKTLEIVSGNTRVDLNKKIWLVMDEEQLDFQEISLDRRAFFNSFKKVVVQQVSDFFNNKTDNVENTSYSQKYLPKKRDILNQTLSTSAGEIRKNLLNNYFYDICIEDSCDGCLDCVAVCPTLALKIHEDTQLDSFSFDPIQCNGCGLCEGFCTVDAIHVKKGILEDKLVSRMLYPARTNEKAFSHTNTHA